VPDDHLDAVQRRLEHAFFVEVELPHPIFVRIFGHARTGEGPKEEPPARGDRRPLPSAGAGVLSVGRADRAVPGGSHIAVAQGLVTQLHILLVGEWCRTLCNYRRLQPARLHKVERDLLRQFGRSNDSSLADPAKLRGHILVSTWLLLCREMRLGVSPGGGDEQGAIMIVQTVWGFLAATAIVAAGTLAAGLALADLLAP